MDSFFRFASPLLTPLTLTVPTMATTTAAAASGTSPFIELHHADPNHSHRHRKVTIVGVGSVGMACALSIVNQHLCSELVLIDVVAEKVRGEVLDLQHGMGAAKLPITVSGGTDYHHSKGSHICVITAGVRQRVGESRPELLRRNADVVGPIVKNLVAHSPNTMLLVVSNPVDAMTWLAWRVSGLPANRVFGSGTTLDSSRFRAALAERCGLPTPSVHAYILAEHGESAVPVYSTANVFGTRLKDVTAPQGATTSAATDPSALAAAAARDVVSAAGTIIKLKGYTSSGIGLCVATMVRAVLRDESVIQPLSTMVPLRSDPSTGRTPFDLNIDRSRWVSEEERQLLTEVVFSVPVILSGGGVRALIKQTLSSAELEAMRASALKVLEMQRELLPAVIKHTPKKSPPPTAHSAAQRLSKL